MKKMLLFLALSSAPGAQQVIFDIQKEVILKRNARIHSYSGSMKETGTLKGKKGLSYKVSFQRPYSYYSEVTSKGAFKGSVYCYDGKTLKVYFPEKKFGYTYENLKPLSIKEAISHTKKNFEWHVKNYRVKLGKVRKVAGKNSLNLIYTPRSNKPFWYTFSAWAYEYYAFPLKVEYQTPVPASYEFTRIAFNRKIDKNIFTFKFPEGAAIARYNFDSKNYTLKQARAEANYPMNLPVEKKMGMKLKKLVKADGFIPAFTAYYKSSPYEMYISTVRDYGIKIVPDRGVKMKGKTSYFVNFMGVYTTVIFLYKGVYYTVVSNLPYQKILETCEQLQG